MTRESRWLFDPGNEALGALLRGKTLLENRLKRREHEKGPKDYRLASSASLTPNRHDSEVEGKARLAIDASLCISLQKNRCEHLGSCPLAVFVSTASSA